MMSIILALGTFDKGKSTLRPKHQEESLGANVLCDFRTVDNGAVPEGCDDAESAPEDTPDETP